MSGSELEYSESSNSAESAMDSAYSSPSYQLPSNSDFTGFAAAKDHVHNASLKIMVQPEKYTRIRYRKELKESTHGCLLGRHDTNVYKTYPTVELVNYTGKAVVRCCLVKEKSDEIHPHKLLMTDERSENCDVCKVVPEDGSYTVCFGGMLIVHTTKKEVVEMFRRNGNRTQAECTKLASAINLTVVRLRFSAHDIDTDQQICPPVYSEPIKDSKSSSSNDLVICRQSRCIGRPIGGDDMYLFVEKVNSKNIKIRFFEIDNCGNRTWERTVHLLEKEVHRQFGIFFRTPPYKNTEISKKVDVFMELYRPNDHHTSKPVIFTYQPEPFQSLLTNKKRKLSQHGASSSSISSGISQNVTSVPVSRMEVIPAQHVSQISQSYETPYTKTSANQMQQYQETQAPQFYVKQMPPQGGLPSSGMEMQQNYVEQNTQMAQSGMQFVSSVFLSPQREIQSPQSVMQSPQSQMHSPQNVMQSPQSGMQGANVMPITPIYEVQLQQNCVIQMSQNGVQSIPAQYNEAQYINEIHIPEVGIQQSNNGVSQVQSGLQLVHQGVVHAPLSAGAQLPHSPQSQKEIYDLDVLDDLQRALATLTNQNVETIASSANSLDTDFTFPTPHQSRASSTEPTGAQSNNSETPDSRIINDPVLGQALAPNLTSIAEEIERNLGADVFDDPEELARFSGMDFSDYFPSDIDFVLRKDSGRAKKDKGLGGESSKKVDSDHTNEYTPYYTAEDGIQVKKLIKEICDIVKEGGYKKQDVRCKLERLFELRLSNEDTFLHMSLMCNISSFEYIVKLIHSMRMTHLLNLTNDTQHTILHLSVIYDMPEVVVFLLEKGCDPMQPDMNGNNAIHHAVMSKASLEPFVAYDLNAHNYEKQTALHLAAIYDSEASARTLLQNGASYNVKDFQGRTPLHLAVYDDRLLVTRALLDFIDTSDMDAVDGLGNTALQIVTSGEIKENSLEILKLLLQKKGDPKFHEGDSSPAYKLARRKPQMWQIMKEYTSVSSADVSEDSSEDEFESADEGDGDSDEIATELADMTIEDKQVKEEKN